MVRTLGEILYPRRKIFVSYHHGGDQGYYDYFSNTFHDNYESISDNSVDRRIDSGSAEYIMRRIREEHLKGSSCTIVLCGAQTWARKYVDWEILASLNQGMGLVGVWLATLPLSSNGGALKPERLQDNLDSGYAVWTRWADILADNKALSRVIEDANSRPKEKIVNRRPSMTRNA